MNKAFQHIDEYIVSFPESTQEKLYLLRELIHSQTPNIEEYIGYQMPAFKYKERPLIYFAGYKNHIGLYPGAEAIKNFMQDFVNYNYKFSKGAVQFPINADLPMDLIQKIVKFRICEIEQNKKS
ncbi:DUF1801 domain-containing protein [Chryseobacterium nematophagum]|uniref:DUF1801 domain-containing protein n=1 Tax=Chryseobacterium nematophagum TaxID=2305228 RepID=A0A3M7TD14_9FLAO|nr:DUF1801 domain-containing protein [Chryseobacterium nematophagum]RNA60924.1 DUF1801 domain-containing protein [Chryseobacterium nematophagum]